LLKERARRLPRHLGVDDHGRSFEGGIRDLDHRHVVVAIDHQPAQLVAVALRVDSVRVALGARRPPGDGRSVRDAPEIFGQPSLPTIGARSGLNGE
jgi:hypothetical protein